MDIELRLDRKARRVIVRRIEDNGEQLLGDMCMSSEFARCLAMGLIEGADIIDALDAKEACEVTCDS